MTRHTLNRRSFFQRVVGASIGGATLAALSGRASATDTDPTDPGARRTDRDPTDGVNQGRSTGVTDRDAGDLRGQGRGNVQPSAGISDRDSGPCADPAGRGAGNRTRRACNGVTDRDTSDERGRGRGTR